MKFRVLLLAIILFPLAVLGQKKQPKLIVGIVVDQMKYEYLIRFAHNFGDDGFNRMMKKGYQCKNTHFNYIPTYTGPGHASIYTGTTPSVHGIIANNFYDKFLGEKVYCAFDSTVTQTGGDKKAGMMSARRVLTTTIGDEMKMANPKSKVIGISEKDRASAFPAGHLADAAYWLEGKKFISSTAYIDKVPQWVKKFNDKKLVEKYLSKPWERIYPVERYVSQLDRSPYERLFAGETQSVFPHDLPAILEKEERYGLIKNTPFGNTITADLAIAAIEGEQLGKDDNMDLLCVSFSSTDYIGHFYGTRAMETEDTYYRLDQDIARLFDYLDDQVGKRNYVVFLTADHGAAVPPGFLKDKNVPSGYFNADTLAYALDSMLDLKYSSGDWIKDMTNNYIFLNQELIASNDLDKISLYRWIKDFLLNSDGVYRAYDRISLMENDYSDWLGSRVKNGFNDRLSPDIIYLLEPGFIDERYQKGGTSHGSGYTYDTHVPLLWMGAGIWRGSSDQLISITDIVPTLCTKYNIPFPSGCTGSPIPMKR